MRLILNKGRPLGKWFEANFCKISCVNLCAIWNRETRHFFRLRRLDAGPIRIPVDAAPPVLDPLDEAR